MRVSDSRTDDFWSVAALQRTKPWTKQIRETQLASWAWAYYLLFCPLLSFYKIVSEWVSYLVTFVFQGLAERSSASQKWPFGPAFNFDDVTIKNSLTLVQVWVGCYFWILFLIPAWPPGSARLQSNCNRTGVSLKTHRGIHHTGGPVIINPLLLDCFARFLTVHTRRGGSLGECDKMSSSCDFPLGTDVR